MSEGNLPNMNFLWRHITLWNTSLHFSTVLGGPLKQWIISKKPHKHTKNFALKTSPWRTFVYSLRAETKGQCLPVIYIQLQLGTCISSGNSTFLLLCACLNMPANDLKNVVSIDSGVTNEFRQAVKFAYTESTSNRVHCILVNYKRCIFFKIFLVAILFRQENGD